MLPRAELSRELRHAPEMPPSVDVLMGYSQPLVAETDGSLRLGGPSSFLLLDESFLAP
jgi:hypothetical protein